ncbi:MAG: phosphopantothenoylcysteine decarboxylase, partial [Kiritimatiellia bacterium]|nr:phosphopantothenoylcysteine decarboxylase [Kiritimatiellia bacterium]
VQALENKGPKTSKPWKLDLESTPDIAAEICKKRRKNQYAVGFALESGDGLRRAEQKLASKGLNAIVLNGPEAMGSDEADYRCLQTVARGVMKLDWGPLKKTECARRILGLAGF